MRLELSWLALACYIYPGVMGKDWESPEFPLLFRQPLPIPPVKQPKQYASETIYS